MKKTTPLWGGNNTYPTEGLCGGVWQAAIRWQGGKHAGHAAVMPQRMIEPYDHLNIANHARGSLLNESYVNGVGEVGVKTWGRAGSAGGRRHLVGTRRPMARWSRGWV
jgi:hypothetical protein